MVETILPGISRGSCIAIGLMRGRLIKAGFSSQAVVFTASGKLFVLLGRATVSASDRSWLMDESGVISSFFFRRKNTIKYIKIINQISSVLNCSLGSSLVVSIEIEEKKMGYFVANMGTDG